MVLLSFFQLYEPPNGVLLTDTINVFLVVVIGDYDNVVSVCENTKGTYKCVVYCFLKVWGHVIGTKQNTKISLLGSFGYDQLVLSKSTLAKRGVGIFLPILNPS